MVLENYFVLNDGSLRGHVYDSPKFNDGDIIATSPVKEVIDFGDWVVAKTASGSRYTLHRDHALKGTPDAYFDAMIKNAIASKVIIYSQPA